MPNKEQLSVSNALAGQPFVIEGSGFKRNAMVYVGIEFYCCLVPVAANKQGEFQYTHPGLPSAGNYTAVAMVFQGNDWKLVAESDFAVT